MTNKDKEANKVLLIITGSIAAVKCPDLISQLKDKGIDVTCVLTKGGEGFITPLSLASLSGNKVYKELFSLTDETDMGHIALSRKNDLIVVAPASANILAKMTYGLADDLASTLLLATDKPVLAVPAMNVKMWQHPATKRNVKQLKEDGIAFVGPNKGDLACGEEGFGRMAEPSEIVVEIEKFLIGKGNRRDENKPLSGYSALVTSGPTIEAIDPVRYITNRSSGKQGNAVAASLAKLGADVTLITGPTNRPAPKGVNVVSVESAKEMLLAAEKAIPVDIAICAAAVADWGVAQVAKQKIKKTGNRQDFTLTFAENPDILVALSKNTKNRPKLVIGFAAETELVIENARVKLEQKGCDWIVANDVSDGKVFESDENMVHIITATNQEDWPKLTKEQVAEKLASKIAEYFNSSSTLKLVSEKAG